MSGVRSVFFCRGSSEVGLGHIMRTRAVAEEASELGECTIVVVGDLSAKTLLEGAAAQVIFTESDHEAAELMRNQRPDVAVFDTMHFQSNAFESIAQRSLTASLSPIFDRLEHCDRFYHRTREHSLRETPSWKPQWRAGFEYAVVRRGVQRISRAAYEHTALSDDPLSVAISMGGGDAQNSTLRVLEHLRAIDRPMLFWALLGEGYQHSLDDLIQCVRADKRHEIIIARTTDAMWRVLRSCSVAVLAGGTVTFEAIAAGLPSINLLSSPGHAFLIREAVERGVAFSAGDNFEQGLDRTADYLRQFDADRAMLINAHRASEGLIDGLAAKRIAQDLAKACAHAQGAAA